MTGKVGKMTTNDYERLTGEERFDPNYEFREILGGTARVRTVESMAEEIGDEYESDIWDLKIKIFERMKAMKAIPENAEGSDYEEIIKEVLDELWRRA